MEDEATPPTFTTATPTPPQRTGLVGLLADRRQQLVDAQVLTLEVPRWGPPYTPRLKIEYHPIHHSILRRGALQQEQRIKNTSDASKQADTEIDTNADILINGCIKIIAILDDGEELGLGVDGEYTKFDPEAAITLGIPGSTARQVCRKIFITDADLLRHARKLSQWSGYTNDDVDEALEGE